MSLDVELYMDVDLGGKEPEHFVIFSENITHNLSTMAEKAGIYRALWRPDELYLANAGNLISYLEDGLRRLEGDPEYYRTFDPENGWGKYENLVNFVREYLKACRKYPKAQVDADR